MKNQTTLLECLTRIIACKSVQTPTQENAPFGRECKKALDIFLDYAKSLGLKTINYDNYGGEVIVGNGVQEIGIIGHLDVVPAGDGWDTDPFTLTIKNDTYYARGIADDKGPLVAVLFAMAEVKEFLQNSNKRFRLIVGCNEETGWRDIEYIKTKTKLPPIGFSPDGNFPLSYAEKGVYVLDFLIPKLKNFHNLSGGNVINAVCAYASCVADKNGLNECEIFKKGLFLKDGNKIESIGKSAHGSQPQLGVNALKSLFEYFAIMGENVQNALDCLFYDKYGVKKLHNEQGVTTISPNLLYEKEDGVHILCDCRLPAPLAFSSLKEVLDRFGICYEIKEKHPPFMIEKEGWFVQTLLNAYNTVTGENAQPTSLCGSTFARAFDKGCAFGAEFPNAVSHIHEPNECVSIADFEKMYEIYRTALIELSK